MGNLFLAPNLGKRCSKMLGERSAMPRGLATGRHCERLHISATQVKRLRLVANCQQPSDSQQQLSRRQNLLLQVAASKLTKSLKKKTPPDVQALKSTAWCITLGMSKVSIRGVLLLCSCRCGLAIACAGNAAHHSARW